MQLIPEGVGTEDLEMIEGLLKHCRLLRKSPNPRKAVAAGQWEIFFGEILKTRQEESAPVLTGGGQ